jgi:hypothetical protein
MAHAARVRQHLEYLLNYPNAGARVPRVPESTHLYQNRIFF